MVVIGSLVTVVASDSRRGGKRDGVDCEEELMMVKLKAENDGDANGEKRSC